MPKLIAIPENLQGVTRFDVQITDIEPVNDLFSKALVKVLYPGLNRNNIFIEKSVAEQMAKTIYNIPVVGEYIETIEDFKDHGGKIEITSDDIQFIQTTKPYGFVPEDSEVVWQNVREEDGTIREYLTCTAYLWTGRYPEVETVIKEGRPQSMELDEDTIEGYWKQEGTETIFHITKAFFSALCILGKDVPPAFESATIGSYYVANPIAFSKRFRRLLQDYEQTVEPLEKKVVNFAANNDKEEGGYNMLQFSLKLDPDHIKTKMYNVLNPIEKDERLWNYSIVNINEENKEIYCVREVDNQAYKLNYSWENDGNDLKFDWDDKTEITITEYTPPVDNSKELEELQTKYDKVESDYKELEAKYNKIKDSSSDDKDKEIETLQTENKELKEFKEKIENEEKDNTLTKFSAILSEEDLKPFKEEKEKYTKDALEEKLSVIAIRKADFNKDNAIFNLIPDPKDNATLSGVEKLIEKHKDK